MNINDLKNIASTFGLSGDAVNNTLNCARQNGILNNGELNGSPEQFRNIVNSYGGMPKLNEAMKKLDNPLIRNALKLCGINIDKAKEAALKAMGMGTTETAADAGIAARLKKLM